MRQTRHAVPGQVFAELERPSRRGPCGAGPENRSCRTPRSLAAHGLRGRRRPKARRRSTPMLRLVSTSSNTREFRTFSRSQSPMRLQKEDQQTKESRRPQGRQQPAQRRVQLRGVAPIEVTDEQQNHQARRDGQNPIGVRLDASPVESRAQSGRRPIAAGCASCGASLRQAAPIDRMIAGRPGENLLAEQAARRVHRKWPRPNCSRPARPPRTGRRQPARTDT